MRRYRFHQRYMMRDRTKGYLAFVELAPWHIRKHWPRKASKRFFRLFDVVFADPYPLQFGWYGMLTCDHPEWNGLIAGLE